jgi:hypothetical protein
MDEKLLINVICRKKQYMIKEIGKMKKSKVFLYKKPIL